MTRSRVWVSKTDMTRFVRCPYSFWLMDTGQISFEDTIDEFQAGLLRQGREFQMTVDAAAASAPVDPIELSAALEADVTLVGLPTFENPKLKIYGQPDWIEPEGGALIPVEVKAHKDVQPTDELELAFYWMVLDGHRTRRDVEPRGLLVLKRDATRSELVEVPIKAHRFEEVKRLLHEIRRPRRYGVQPRICRCIVCRDLRSEEVLAGAHGRKDLTLVFGIGRDYARALEDRGITTYEDLIASDPATVVGVLRERRYFVSAAQVAIWQRHAQVWVTGRPAYFGSEPCVGDQFIAVDLEYDQISERIWLTGVCVVDGDDRDYSLLWAEDGASERASLRRLATIVASHPKMPVVTWAGNGADIPKLRAVSDRLRLQALAPLFERHIDLFAYARDSVRLPVPRLDLKSLCDYFGLGRTSTIKDGMQAQSVYLHYLSTRRADLQQRLLDYNKDDLNALIALARELRGLAEADNNRLVAR
jgi:predicted RecB family nuclease